VWRSERSERKGGAREEDVSAKDKEKTSFQSTLKGDSLLNKEEGWLITSKIDK